MHMTQIANAHGCMVCGHPARDNRPTCSRDHCTDTFIKAFRIEGPAVISFSGGRTSGYMLRHVLDAHGGKLPADVHVLFANTGKEREETLQFVHAVMQEWGVYVHWLEYRNDGMPEPDDGGEDRQGAFAEVTFESASRKGEPFKALIGKRGFLPNPVTRFCTTEMKIRVMKAWMMAHGFTHWDNVVGIRADEPRRAVKLLAPKRKERWEVLLPLYRANVTVAHVSAFWGAQSFDLQLRPWEGNCDLCFLKGRAKKQRIIRDNPELVTWWIEAEAEARASKPEGARFRATGPDYKKMASVVARQPLLMVLEDPPDDDDDMMDCICGGAS